MNSLVSVPSSVQPASGLVGSLAPVTRIQPVPLGSLVMQPPMILDMGPVLQGGQMGTGNPVLQNLTSLPTLMQVDGSILPVVSGAVENNLNYFVLPYSTLPSPSVVPQTLRAPYTTGLILRKQEETGLLYATPGTMVPLRGNTTTQGNSPAFPVFDQSKNDKIVDTNLKKANTTGLPSVNISISSASRQGKKAKKFKLRLIAPVDKKLCKNKQLTDLPNNCKQESVNEVDSKSWFNALESSASIERQNEANLRSKLRDKIFQHKEAAALSKDTLAETTQSTGDRVSVNEKHSQILSSLLGAKSKIRPISPSAPDDKSCVPKRKHYRHYPNTRLYDKKKSKQLPVMLSLLSMTKKTSTQSSRNMGSDAKNGYNAMHIKSEPGLVDDKHDQVLSSVTAMKRSSRSSDATMQTRVATLRQHTPTPSKEAKDRKRGEETSSEPQMSKTDVRVENIKCGDETLSILQTPSKNVKVKEKSCEDEALSIHIEAVFSVPDNPSQTKLMCLRSGKHRRFGSKTFDLTLHDDKLLQPCFVVLDKINFTHSHCNAKRLHRKHTRCSQHCRENVVRKLSLQEQKQECTVAEPATDLSTFGESSLQHQLTIRDMLVKTKNCTKLSDALSYRREADLSKKNIYKSPKTSTSSNIPTGTEQLESSSRLATSFAKPTLPLSLSKPCSYQPQERTAIDKLPDSNSNFQTESSTIKTQNIASQALLRLGKQAALSQISALEKSVLQTVPGVQTSSVISQTLPGQTNPTLHTSLEAETPAVGLQSSTPGHQNMLFPILTGLGTSNVALQSSLNLEAQSMSLQFSPRLHTLIGGSQSSVPGHSNLTSQSSLQLGALATNLQSSVLGGSNEISQSSDVVSQSRTSASQSSSVDSQSSVLGKLNLAAQSQGIVTQQGITLVLGASNNIVLQPSQILGMTNTVLQSSSGVGIPNVVAQLPMGFDSSLWFPQPQPMVVSQPSVSLALPTVLFAQPKITVGPFVVWENNLLSAQSPVSATVPQIASGLSNHISGFATAASDRGSNPLGLQAGILAPAVIETSAVQIQNVKTGYSAGQAKRFKPNILTAASRYIPPRFSSASKWHMHTVSEHLDKQTDTVPKTIRAPTVPIPEQCSADISALPAPKVGCGNPPSLPSCTFRTLKNVDGGGYKRKQSGQIVHTPSSRPELTQKSLLPPTASITDVPLSEEQHEIALNIKQEYDYCW